MVDTFDLLNKKLLFFSVVGTYSVFYTASPDRCLYDSFIENGVPMAQFQ